MTFILMFGTNCEAILQTFSFFKVEQKEPDDLVASMNHIGNLE